MKKRYIFNSTFYMICSLKYLFFFFFLLSIFFPITANNTIVLSEKNGAIQLQENLWYFSPEKEIDYTEALKSRNLFSPLRQSNFLGYQKNSIWLRLLVKNLSEKEDWVLYTNQSQIDEIELFNSSENSSLLIGDKVIDENHAKIWGRLLHFTVHIPKGETLLLYLRLRNEGSLLVDWHMQEFISFHRYLYQSSFFSILYLGALFFAAVFSFIWFLFSRSLKFFSYSLLLFLGSSILFLQDGFLFQWLKSPFISNQFFLVLIFFTLIAFLFFFLQSIISQKDFPIFHSLFVLFTFVFFIFGILSLFVSYSLSETIAFIVLGIVFILCFSALFAYFRKEYILGIFFLFSNLFVFAGITGRVMFYHGILKSDFHISGTFDFFIVLGFLLFLVTMFLQEHISWKKLEYESDVRFDTLLTEKEKQEQQLKTYQEKIKDSEKLSRFVHREVFNHQFLNEARIEIEPIFLSVAKTKGDFYDIFQISNNRYRIFIADTCGAGTDAVLASLAVKAEYQEIKNLNKNLSSLIKNMNESFVKKFSSLNVFFTCFLMDIDLENASISYVSAGHPDQIIIEKNQARLLKHSGRLVGFTSNLEYKEHQEKLNDKSRLYLFSKGIVEEKNKENILYGTTRLYEKFYQLSENQLKESLHLLIEDVKEFNQYKNFSNDILLIGIEINLRNSFKDINNT